MLPKWQTDVKRVLFDYFETDFSPDSIINTEFRKTDLTNFAMFHEGNVYNKLINMVSNHLNTTNIDI